MVLIIIVGINGSPFSVLVVIKQIVSLAKNFRLLGIDCFPWISTFLFFKIDYRKLKNHDFTEVKIFLDKDLKEKKYKKLDKPLTFVSRSLKNI